ncbi:MAG TPA: ATP-dependent sacrificial sulfur transferase LarE [Candidatus Acidoferrales bacterium]|nr:ATP-dependent sacrificial sulfur transferase LarE [Candidatus Acidoferrales bacterium]
MSNVTSHKMLTEESPRGLSPLEGSEIPPELCAKATRILDELRSYQKVMVAFSGGVDSTVVALLASIALRDNAIAVTADSPSLPTSELEEAKELAQRIGIKHIVVKTDELQDPNYIANPANRCYFCKKELGQKLMELAKELGEYTIVDGTNAEDLKSHRPGAAALTEKGIRRPLAEAGMMKNEVRQLAKSMGLSNHDKPSMPCLSSRVAYGEIITPERLLRIERAETIIRSLTGVNELRVRDHGSVARIEVGAGERSLFFDEQLLDRISEALHELGYVHVALDMTGYRSGSMNGISSSMRDRK